MLNFYTSTFAQTKGRFLHCWEVAISRALNFRQVCLILMVIVLYPFVTLKAQQRPNISYSQSNYNFSKGVAIAPIAAPSNSGGTIPAKIRGGVEESFGLGGYNANRISKREDGKMMSFILGKNTIHNVDLTNRRVTDSLINRDKPWGIVKDSKGNVYWTETGSYQIVTNPNRNDETSYLAGALALGENAPKIGGAISFFNNVSSLYSYFSGGDDLLRKITGQEAKPNYILRFSGKIYKLTPGSNTPQVFLSDVQMPTGLAIDQNDNLYVSCFTANFTVKGGISFSGGEVEVVDDESGTYNAKIIKITPEKQQTDIGSWPGIDYPTQLGIDAQGNITLMYHYGNNMVNIGITRIRKYPEGQTTGNTYPKAVFLLNGGTAAGQAYPAYQDMAVDAGGNVYLSDFYADKIMMLPMGGSSSSDLQVFSENALSPCALYIDLNNNQLWVKEGRYTTTGAIKKLSLYGYAVTPSLPLGLSLTTNGTITGTASTVSPNRPYTITASNVGGFSSANLNIEIRQIAAPNISYATNVYNLPIAQVATIPTPNNAGGSFNQQIGPLKVDKVYKGGTKMRGFAFDADGNKYFCQPDSNRIMKIDAAGRMSVYISGLNEPYDIEIDRTTGVFYFTEKKGLTLKAMYAGFAAPTTLLTGSVTSMAIDQGNYLYACNPGLGLIYRYNLKTNDLETFASNVGRVFWISIYNNAIYGLTADGVVKKIPISNPSAITTVANLGSNGFEMAMDDYGNIFAAGDRLFKIAAGSTTVETYTIPNNNAWYFEGLGVDRDNNLYVTSVASGYQSFEVIKVTAGGFVISPSLPAGLTFNNNGTITGTPTTITAAKDYTVKAANPLGESSAVIRIGVNNVPTTNLQYVFPATIHRTIALGEILPTVTGGKPDSFSIAPTLPDGLVFNTTTGKISGTPTANKVATTYTITANNTVGSATATINFAVTEIPPLSLTYAMASNVLQKDIAVNLNPTVTGGSIGVTYAVSPALPAGLSFSTSTGVISGTPTTITAQKSYTITISNNGGSQQTSFNLSVKLDPPSNLVYTIAASLLRDVTLENVTPSYNGAGVSSFSITPTLPAGLSFNTTTGVISGKPTAVSAATSYTITATNLGGNTTTTFSLAVRVDEPSSLQYAIANSILRNQALTAITPTYEGSPAASFSVSPTLPTGLSFNTTTGAISGTPTVMTATKSYTVTATNDGGTGTVTFPLEVRVDPPINLKYDFAHTSLLRNNAIPTVTPTYTGSPATGFNISPALPAGLAFNATTGAISGTPTAITAAQTYTVTVVNDGGSSTASFSLLVTELAPTSLQYTFSNSSLLRDVAITAVRPSYGGGTATSFTISPALPAGLTLNASTGVISGTPTVISGNTNYTVTAGNTAGNTTASFSLLVRVDPPANLQYTITSSVLRDIVWSNKLPTYTSGSPIASFSISPTLPAGLGFNTSTGVISGTPTAISTNKSYTVTATNDGGNTTYSFDLAVRVDAPTNLRYDFRDTELQKDVAMLSVTPKYSGSPTNTFSISPSLPTGLVFDSSTGQISGTPTVLSSVINYTVTATNDGGTGNASFSLSVSRIPTPEITYATTKYSYTKGTPITAIPAPTNTGAIFPQQRIGEALYTGLTQPTGVATDAAGNTYIADYEGGNAKIKKLEKGGTEITDFVSSGLGAIAPYDLAVDVAGNVYMSAGGTIKKITPAKVVSDFATGLNNVGGLFIDTDNDLYVAEYSAGQILRFANCNATAKTIPITGLNIGATLATPAENPRDIVVDKQKNIYVLQAGLLSDYRVSFMFLFKYFASDSYAKGTRNRILTSVDFSSYMTIDKKDNLYINTDGNSVIILNNYVDKGGRLYSQLTSGKMKGISLDADQNAFYALAKTNSALGKNFQFGYNTAGLPNGLVLNANGTITGTPTAVRSETNYTVTANSFYGKSTGTLQITVVDTVPKFQYAQPNQVLTAGVSNLNIAPTKTGGPINSYSVTPTLLPAGISFNTATGTFSGTPTKLQDTVSTYVVAATNTGGTGKDTVTFKINDKIPSGLVYPPNYVLYVNKQFRGEVPTISGGAVTKWSISPALPEGLSIDTLTGVIIGYANVTSSAANYTVKAENSGGATTGVVNLTVKDLPPSISYAQQNTFKFKKDETITKIAPPDNTGGPIVSYSISGLPNGLTLNTDGSISGRPNSLTKSTEYKIIANGGQWGKDTTSLSIEVVSLPPNTITYNSPVTLIKGTAITNIAPSYTSTGGDPVEQFTITPELPAGLTLNPTTGVISGTPTQILGSNGQLYYVTASNGAGSNSTSLLFLLKDLPPAITYQTEHVLTKGVNASLAVNSTGGAVTKYTVSPALPTGLSLDSLTGQVYGTPSALTLRAKYSITATNYGNPAKTADVYLTIVDQKPAINYEASHQLVRTVEITPITVNSTGGAVISYQISPALPEGLSLDALTGTISGTPTLSAVEKTYTVTATNTGGSITATMNIAVKNAKPVIAYNSVYVFNKNIAVSDIAPQSTGGNQITFSLNPATLPNGLSFNTQTGVISGTPIDTAVLRTYDVYAVNDGGKDTATFTLKVNEKIPGDISYAELADDFYVGHAINPMVPIVGADGGAIARFTISPTNLAPGLSFNTQTGVLSGTPTADYVRTSYTVTAHNSGGIKQTTLTFAVIKLSATLAKTDAKCNGSATGSATVTVIGGKAPYSYTWSQGATAATANNLVAGTYTVVIKDANQTTITRTVTIEESSALIITNISKVDNQQNGGASGTATATVTGGVGPYTYSWSANNSTTANAIGLSEGSYTLTVTDANQCMATKTVFIDAPPAAPMGLMATAGNAHNILTWSASSETDLSGYKVYGGTTANPTHLLQVVTAPIVTYTHSNLNNGTPYYYRITSVDKGGFESVYSTEVSATPQGTQSISFAVLPAKTYGDADFSAGATTSSGLTVTYTSDNPQVATIVAGKVHIVGAGTANITAAQNGNQNWLAAVSQTQQLTVNKRALTISANAQDKTYDGLRNAQVSLNDNRVTGDEINVAYTTALFNNKNVGAGKLVTVSGINISGIAALNYTHNVSATTIADINVKALTITAMAQNKTYDGNNNASVTLNDDRISGDQLETSYISASFNNKNVGTDKVVNVSGIRINGTDAGNYTINTSTATTGNITTRTLIVSASGIHKVYDGNVSATVNVTDNRVAGDVLNVQYANAVFADKKVGIAKEIAVSGIQINGANAANYTVNTTASTTANITARNLTVTAAGNSKVYDGGFTATVNLTDDRVTGDQLTAAYAIAMFGDKNVGTNKSIAVFGITISGTDAANYLVNATANTSAAITPKVLTVTADNKTTIQGLALPALTVKYAGFINGEDNNSLTTLPSLSTSATSTSPQGDYPITVAGTTAQNYSITPVNGVLTVIPGTPTSLTFNQGLLLENSVSGTIAGVLNSTAPDPNAVFTYSLVTGAGDTDNSKFRIVGNSIHTAAVFDYETQNSFNIRVRTTTQYGSSLEQTFVVNVTDVNEVPTLANIANQTICYTSTTQTVALSGITAGPETNQNVTVSVASNNSRLFSSLTASNVNGGNALVNYRLASGQSGSATITVTITDNGGIANGGVNVISKTFDLVVNALPEIEITSDLGTSFSKGQTTTLTATGGVTYQWSGPSGIIGDRNTATLKVRPDQANSTYTVTVTTAAGCTSTRQITLTTAEDIRQIAGTNIVTPNGDGVNDNLIIKNVDLYPDNELEIFDRAGRKIYTKKGYQNEWNGMLNGIPLAEGTYYYIINFKNVGKYKGFITIIKD